VKKILIILILYISFGAKSQQFPITWGIMAGGASILGEMGNSEGDGKASLGDLNLSTSRWSFGAFIRRELNQTFAFKAVISYSRLSGNDLNDKNLGRKQRNLNFNNDVIEISPQMEFSFYNFSNYGRSSKIPVNLNAYVFIGTGIFYHNPTTQLNGKTYSLREIRTEGKSYSPIALSVPFGFGAYLTLKRKLRLGIEFSYRFTTTDYLDDISSTYPDISAFTNPEHALLSHRYLLYEKSDVKPENFESILSKAIPEGRTRGNPASNDGYASVMVSIAYPIRKFQQRGFNYTQRKYNVKRRKTKKIRF
jgi:hypothetical protein